MSMVNSIIWIVLLFCVVWPCASCGGFVYVLVAPFEACIPACAPVLEFSMKLLVWSKTAGKGIAAGTEITFC